MFAAQNMAFAGVSDGLALDLQFATDKRLTARKGPTPTFTRASFATYYGPFISRGGTTIPSVADRTWQIGDYTDGQIVSYASDRWAIENFSGGESEYFEAAVGNEVRPEQADWSASGTTPPTTSSTFGIIFEGTHVPRFDYDPITLACKGLLIEESRTNLVLQSDTLTTQTRTVTAVAHTLSFYGTGTVVLSGVHVATVTGTGAFPTRTTLTFTPTAGSLILTVTGSVTQAQLEAGAFPTSYIPTTTASAVRSADVCSITGSAFTGFYKQSEGTLFAQTQKTSTNTLAFMVAISDNSFNNAHHLRYTDITTPSVLTNVGAVPQTPGFSGTITSGATAKQIMAYKLNDYAYSLNGAASITDTVALVPTVNRLNIGAAYNSAQVGNGHIASIRYYRKRLPNAKLQTLTT